MSIGDLALAWGLAACSFAAVGVAKAQNATQDGLGYVPVGADVLVSDRPAEGLLVLHSGYRNHPLVDADAVAWLGAGDDTQADVLTANIGVRDPSRLGFVRLGRFILATGAVRPVHIDGGYLRVSAPVGSSLELFGGVPVLPFAIVDERDQGERDAEGAALDRDFDWLVGSRLSQRLLDERAGVGVSYLQRRDAGMTADEEVGADLTLQPLSWLNVSALAAFDLTHEGLAEARLFATAIAGDLRARLFAEQRVASRLLQATSLFSVISDDAASEAGADLHYRAFPRLDIGATAALLTRDALEPGEELALGYRAALRSTLRLDDEGEGSIALEANRRRIAGEGFSGVALAGEQPLGRYVVIHGRFELVVPDAGSVDEARLGELWPWARAGATLHVSPSWRLAGALEARATPEYREELRGLLRLGYRAQVGP